MGCVLPALGRGFVSQHALGLIVGVCVSQHALGRKVIAQRGVGVSAWGVSAQEGVCWGCVADTPGPEADTPPVNRMTERQV